ncbi:MAG: AAA family ATPase [Rhodospirillaceae bacterium]|nr:AAA family ATPase [Rhodospirillaceae bacterium]
MRIVAIVSPKGGTGKSSVATALAVEAAGRGATLLYDLDPQETAARWHGIHRRQAAEEGRLSLGMAMRRVARPERAAAEMLRDAESSSYEWAICDTAGGAYRALGEVAALADLLIAPVQPWAPDLAAAPRLAAFVAGLPSPPPLVALLSRVPARAGARADFARAALSDAGISCFTASIRQSVVWPDAYEQGRAPQEMPVWRSHRAAREVKALFGEVADMIDSIERKERINGATG